MSGLIPLVLALTLTLALGDAASAQDTPGAQRGPRPFARAWIGVAFDLPPQGTAGVVIREVMPGAPAEVAGIRVGDRIVRWNGRTDVAEAIRATELAVGDSVRLRIARTAEAERDLVVVADARARSMPRGRAVTPVRPMDVRRFQFRSDSLSVQADSLQARLRVLFVDSLGPQLEAVRERLQETLERTRENREEVLRAQRELAEQLAGARVLQREYADSIRAAVGRPGIVVFRGDSLALREVVPGLGVALAGPRNAVAGAEVTDLTPGLSGYFGAERGVLVLRVAPGTPAAHAGLQDGDVIVAAGGAAVAGVVDLRRAMVEARDAAGLDLEVIRRGTRETVRVAR